MTTQTRNNRLSILILLSLMLSGPAAFAKHEGGNNSHAGNHGWKDGSTPPGWSHGKKTGWHGAHRPPGLAKKEGDHKNGKDKSDKSEEKEESKSKETEKSN